jgi:dolichol-phosphate mannosyltransferase
MMGMCRHYLAMSQSKNAVVLPAYKASAHILEVISDIGPEVWKIIVVDDGCPESSGKLVSENVSDHRVEVIVHEKNMGVGAAMASGYRRALEVGAEVVIKMDADGQMDPNSISRLIAPILSGAADYAKGNRFSNFESISQMPKNRVFGNLALSFFSKLSTGYWGVFDSNNGFTAIKRDYLAGIQLEKVDKGYFFESDMLFRLGIINARIIDVPMPSRYGTEVSSLRIQKVLVEFPIKHARNFLKRVIYSYFLRDFNLASLELVFGALLICLGSVLAIFNWFDGLMNKQATPTGTLVLVLLTILSGLQLLLAFFSFDMQEKGRNR